MMINDDVEKEKGHLAEQKLQRCDICGENSWALKLLSNCCHAYCSYCILRWGFEKAADSPDNCRYTVSCPQCRQLTHLPDDTTNSLKTKYAGNIKCFDCNLMKSIDDNWWCSTCTMVICSKCTLIKHREHAIDPYNAHDALAICFSWLRQSLEKARNRNTSLCRALMQLVNNICLQITNDQKNAHQARESGLARMRSLLQSYGAGEATMIDCDLTHACKRNLPLVAQQLFQLAGLEGGQCFKVDMGNAEELLEELKRKISQLTVSDLQSAERTVIQKSTTLTPVPKWAEVSSIRSVELLRPVDLCLLPDQGIAVADAKSGLLLFDANMVFAKCLSCVPVRSVCYSSYSCEIVAAVPQEQRAICYEQSTLKFTRHLATPPADLWLRIRCNGQGVLYYASYDASACCVNLHTCSKEAEWQTVAMIHDCVQQFFAFDFVPLVKNTPFLDKVLLLTDTGNMYEITIEKVGTSMLKHTRHVQVDSVSLVAPTALTITKRGTVIVVDEGRFYTIEPSYTSARAVGCIDSTALVTSVLIKNDQKSLLCAMANRQRVAMFNLEN